MPELLHDQPVTGAAAEHSGQLVAVGSGAWHPVDRKEAVTPPACAPQHLRHLERARAK